MSDERYVVSERHQLEALKRHAATLADQRNFLESRLVGVEAAFDQAVEELMQARRALDQLLDERKEPQDAEAQDEAPSIGEEGRGRQDQGD